MAPSSASLADEDELLLRRFFLRRSPRGLPDDDDGAGFSSCFAAAVSQLWPCEELLGSAFWNEANSWNIALACELSLAARGESARCGETRAGEAMKAGGEAKRGSLASSGKKKPEH